MKRFKLIAILLMAQFCTFDHSFAGGIATGGGTPLLIQLRGAVANAHELIVRPECDEYFGAVSCSLLKQRFNELPDDFFTFVPGPLFVIDSYGQQRQVAARTIKGSLTAPIELDLNFLEKSNLLDQSGLVKFVLHEAMWATEQFEPPCKKRLRIEKSIGM